MRSARAFPRDIHEVALFDKELPMNEKRARALLDILNKSGKGVGDGSIPCLQRHGAACVVPRPTRSVGRAYRDLVKEEKARQINRKPRVSVLGQEVLLHFLQHRRDEILEDPLVPDAIELGDNHARYCRPGGLSFAELRSQCLGPTEPSNTAFMAKGKPHPDKHPQKFSQLLVFAFSAIIKSPTLYCYHVESGFNEFVRVLQVGHLLQATKGIDIDVRLEFVGRLFYVGKAVRLQVLLLDNSVFAVSPVDDISFLRFEPPHSEPDGDLANPLGDLDNVDTAVRIHIANFRVCEAHRIVQAVGAMEGSVVKPAPAANDAIYCLLAVAGHVVTRRAKELGSGPGIRAPDTLEAAS